MNILSLSIYFHPFREEYLLSIHHSIQPMMAT